MYYLVSELPPALPVPKSRSCRGARTGPCVQHISAGRRVLFRLLVAEEGAELIRPRLLCVGVAGGSRSPGGIFPASLFGF